MTSEFKSILFGLFEIYNQEVSSVKANIYWSTLGQYPIQSLRVAANVWVRKSKFMPKPADLIKLMGGASNHLSADEAWAIAILASDESNTIVWTNEMAKAWTLAEIVYRNGDHIGARRTFIEAYERMINESLMYDKPVEVFVSLGSDKEKRTDVINRAVFTGLLSQERANHYLPKPENTFAIFEYDRIQTVSSNTMKYIQNCKQMIKTACVCIEAN